MQQKRRARKHGGFQHGGPFSASDQDFSPVKRHCPLDEDCSNGKFALLFPNGERRPDLFDARDDAPSKRLCVDSPFFAAHGVTQGAQAEEPAAAQALMDVANGKLAFYGEYFVINKFLRELTFERESRKSFAPSSSSVAAVTSAGHCDDDEL